MSKALCPGEPPFVQCVDSYLQERARMAPYYFFTMFMSFILPFVLTVISYSMILYEIANMQRRDRGICLLLLLFARKISRYHHSSMITSYKTLLTITFVFGIIITIRVLDYEILFKNLENLKSLTCMPSSVS